MTTFAARRVVRRYVQRLHGAPEQVFPLLCPVREYEWIEPWACEVLHSDSGFAEKHCVFRTRPSLGDAAETWIVSNYEPPTRIEFVRFSPARVIAYSIVLDRQADGSTSATNEQVVTSLDAEGSRLLETQTDESFATEMRMGEAMLNHYLRTGRRSPLAEAISRSRA